MLCIYISPEATYNGCETSKCVWGRDGYGSGHKGSRLKLQENLIQMQDRQEGASSKGKEKLLLRLVKILSHEQLHKMYNLSICAITPLPHFHLVPLHYK